jgi:hypothetical protein
VANEKIFIKQLFYGFNRYQVFLTHFAESLFKVFPSSTNRNDLSLYAIFCYIIIFRFDDIPLEELKALLYVKFPLSEI